MRVPVTTVPLPSTEKTRSTWSRGLPSGGGGACRAMAARAARSASSPSPVTAETKIRGAPSRKVPAVRARVRASASALAAGEADLFVTLRSCPWDHNAGRIILAEAGGSLCDLEGEFLPLDRRTPVLAANAPETLRLVRERYLGAAE